MEFLNELNVFGMLGQIMSFGLFVLGLWYVSRKMNRTGRRGAARLRQLGLTRVEHDGSGAGERFEGVFRGVAAGYATGDRIRTGQVASMAEGGLRQIMFGRMAEQRLCRGSEFWVALGGTSPALAVVDRDDADRLETAKQFVSQTNVITGDPSFDRRFEVRSNDPSWAQAVLDTAVRRRLLSEPHVALFVLDGQVHLSISRTAAQKLLKAYKLKLRGNGYAFFSVLLERAELLLNVCWWFSRRIAEVNASLDTVTSQVPASPLAARVSSSAAPNAG